MRALVRSVLVDVDEALLVVLALLSTPSTAAGVGSTDEGVGSIDEGVGMRPVPLESPHRGERSRTAVGDADTSPMKTEN